MSIYFIYTRENNFANQSGKIIFSTLVKADNSQPKNNKNLVFHNYLNYNIFKRRTHNYN